MEEHSASHWVIEELMLLQKDWLYYSKIFGSADISKQLVNESAGRGTCPFNPWRLPNCDQVGPGQQCERDPRCSRGFKHILHTNGTNARMHVHVT